MGPWEILECTTLHENHTSHDTTLETTHCTMEMHCEVEHDDKHRLEVRLSRPSHGNKTFLQNAKSSAGPDRFWWCTSSRQSPT